MKRFDKDHRNLQPPERRKVVLFLGCLIFATFFWLLFSLSKSYTYSLFAVVRFRNVPVRKGLSLPASTRVLLKLEGTGWSLLNLGVAPGINPGLNLKPASLSAAGGSTSYTLEADLANHRRKFFIDLHDFIAEFNSQLPLGQRILEIQPDTLRYTYQNRQTKRIPLIFRSQLTFDKQYYFQEPLANLPDSITVSGPPQAIARLIKWETPVIQYINLKHSVDTTLLLTDKRYPEFFTDPLSVRFSVKVDQFTEKIVTLPVRLIHNKASEDITLIPSTIKAYMLVPLSHYNMVRPESFDVIGDVNEWRFSKHAKLALKVIHAPSYLRIEKLMPPDIDFMVHH